MVHFAPAVLAAVLLLQGAAAAPHPNPQAVAIVKDGIYKPPVEDILQPERRQGPAEGSGGNGGAHHKRKDPAEGSGGGGGAHHKRQGPAEGSGGNGGAHH